MTNNFKKVIDRQKWVQVSPLPTVHAAGGSICSDLRNTVARNPFVYQLASATVLNRFNIITKGSGFVVSPALGGTFGAGAAAEFAPSDNIRGSIGAGCTTTSIVTTTAITAVGINMLANRGGSGDYGFKVRIIGSSAGGSGKTEERWITGNTGGTTPTLLLDSALSFTPASGDKYEILSGTVLMLSAGTIAATSFRGLEVAANTLANHGTTNLPTPATDSNMIALDEQYVPLDALPGEGMIASQTGTYNGGALKCCVATAAAAGTLTGQATGGDAAVAANRYRNFQIRIVEDTGTPTAVGQRGIIASHTGPGASPVYTMGANWTVTPSATAKYVIELPNLLLLRTAANAVVYTYNYNPFTVNNGTNNIAADAWHVTYFQNAPAVCGAGNLMFPSWGIRPDAANNAKQSFVFNFRGNGAATVDVLDIAGAINGSWETAAVIDGGQLITTGTCGCYAPFDEEGKFGYLNFYTASATNQIFRFDVKNRVMSPYTSTDWLQAGTAAVGGRLATYCAIDGTDKYSVCMLQSHLVANTQELLVLV